MCFTIPRRIGSITGTTAILGGGARADIGGLPECSVGDYVFITAGIAVAKLTPAEGQSIQSLIKETHEQLS